MIADLPADALGTVGVVDETSCRKWGEHTPGVQRQYLGCVGKIDSGIVNVTLRPKEERSSGPKDDRATGPKPKA